MKNKIKIIQAIFIICSFTIFVGKNWDKAAETLNRSPINDLYIDNSNPYNGGECADDIILLKRAEENITNPILEYKVSIN